MHEYNIHVASCTSNLISLKTYMYASICTNALKHATCSVEHIHTIHAYTHNMHPTLRGDGGVCLCVAGASSSLQEEVCKDCNLYLVCGERQTTRSPYASNIGAAFCG